MKCDPPSVQNRPRNEEHRLHVEDDEQHGHDIKAHIIPAARIALRRDSALIGFELRADGGGGRPNKLCQDQSYRGKGNYQHRVNQDRNVRALHRFLTRSILPPLSILRPAYFSKSSSPARLVAFTTALINVTRSFPSSNSMIPSMVHPAGVVTASFSRAGWSPVSRTTLAAPFMVCAASRVATSRGRPTLTPASASDSRMM